MAKNKGNKMGVANILSLSVLSFYLIRTSLCVGEEFLTSCCLGENVKRRRNEVFGLKREKEKKILLLHI